LKERLKTIIDRFEHLTHELSDPAIISDNNKFRELSRERSNLEKLVEHAHQYLDFTNRKEQAEEILKTGGDLVEMAHEEMHEINAAMPALEKLILLELLPKDPNAGKNIMLEIRAGAGGDEASIFAADLTRMYIKYAGKRGWATEILSESFSEKGGYKEVVVEMSGADVYQSLKFESGVHRVQRVPATEAQGRIHTSTVTVALMVEAEETQVTIDDKDLKIETMRAGGAGGQHVNKTESAIRITHMPSGIVVHCMEQRSQIKNRARAMQILRTKLYDRKAAEAAAIRSAERKSQVGTGERNERIRTYNFPQGRMTDHRIGLTLHQLTAVMEGNLEEIIEALQSDEYSRLLAEQKL